MKADQHSFHITQENTFIFPFKLSEFTNISLAQHSAPVSFSGEKIVKELMPAEISINAATFIDPAFTVSLIQQQNKLIVSCSCGSPGGRLCDHQYQSLHSLLNRDDLRIFFDDELRHRRLMTCAADYGLEHEDDLDGYFNLSLLNNKISIHPENPSLLPVSKKSLAALKQKLAGSAITPSRDAAKFENSVKVIILKQHKYYRHLYIELADAQVSREGKLKNPFTAVNPLEELWGTEDPQAIKFFSAISRFQNNIDEKRGAADLPFLKAIVANPLGINAYLHDSDISEKVSAASVTAVELATLDETLNFEINKKGPFFEFTGSLHINGETFSPGDLQTRFNYFLKINDTLYLAHSTSLLTLIDLFKGKGKTLLIHQSKFTEFRDNVINALENNIQISHNYLKAPSLKLLEKRGFHADVEKIIYLSDFGQHISIVPVIRYADVEIPIRSKRQIIATDEKGKEYLVRRDNDAEDRFMSLLLRQHPDFTGQLDNPLAYFYLHKKRFLDENWFLKAFEDWDASNITILGFDEITENRLNPQKAKVTIRVTSGLNWFNTHIDLRYGKKKASLKELRQAIKSRSRFVRLDDGTNGLVPAEWLDKFSAWFSAAEIADDTLRTPKVSYTSLAELYEESLLSDEVKIELREYDKRLAQFKEIKEAALPASLNANLRPYQQHGLNWLNFLDEFNFGGCLADDMGLGKSLQIIAFILSQREKRGFCTNMIVLPTSLIFNWQAELEKFAPFIRVHTAYGSDRSKSVKDFDQYEVVLTSYGTLVSDIGYLKKFIFNYVFFDESQNIKNPQSQRYLAAKALNSRGKIVITGTPIENNTFDLYGQLSVACPGLLGNLAHFRDVYSTPIDKFSVKKRAKELQQKIEPFILRRTKDQVATELPEKIEMLIYCEMQPEQRRVYDAYEKEFREYISSKSEEDLSKSSMHVLKGITRLRQICDSPALAGEKNESFHQSSKIETLITHIEDKSSGHKILVFSQFVTMLDLIRDRLKEKNIAFSYLSGKTTNREAVINEFQNDPAIRVFLISLKAGGTGLNLTEANYVYIVDPWWNPAVENQAIDRCYRIGQKKNVVAVRLICPDTVEEKIMKLQQSKTDRMNDLIRPDTAMLKTLNKSDLLGLLRHSKP